ncbi:MAG: DUF4837 family protein [Candidatus Delongbacteria bacterium]|nr:DUF4837 family protein [Candidatus Delongbacteria bacterium]MCG2760814.1 DUF4837 family protein [Candidatus Delongbacteria bacterium]
MRIKNKSKSLILVILSILLVSCSNFKQPALGPEDLILVLADQTIFDTYKPQLEKIFNDPIYTPMEEYRFNIRRIDMDEFHQGSSKFKYLIFLVNVDSETAEAQFIKKMLSDNIKDGVRNGDYYYAIKEDIWSRAQTVLFLMDSKNIHLSTYLENFKEKMFGVFNDRMMTDVKNRLFDRYNNKMAQDYTKRNYNIDIFVPHDFTIVEEGSKTEKFIRYRRFNPDRWLTVLRTNYNTGLTFQENIIQTRDRIGKQFGDSVRVNTELISFQADSTFSSDGLKAQGLWEYFEGGGPFFTYAFLKNGTFYMIDGAVFAPSKKKYPFVIQLDLMAKTVKFLELEN